MLLLPLLSALQVSGLQLGNSSIGFGFGFGLASEAGHSNKSCPSVESCRACCSQRHSHPTSRPKSVRGSAPRFIGGAARQCQLASIRSVGRRLARLSGFRASRLPRLGRKLAAGRAAKAPKSRRPKAASELLHPSVARSACRLATPNCARQFVRHSSGPTQDRKQRAKQRASERVCSLACGHRKPETRARWLQVGVRTNMIDANSRRHLTSDFSSPFQRADQLKCSKTNTRTQTQTQTQTNSLARTSKQHKTLN